MKNSGFFFFPSFHLIFRRRWKLADETQLSRSAVAPEILKPVPQSPGPSCPAAPLPARSPRPRSTAASQLRATDRERHGGYSSLGPAAPGIGRSPRTLAVLHLSAAAVPPRGARGRTAPCAQIQRQP